jgi:tRNA nucleotidyltransferase (CCA-adding enzyme)
VTVLTDRIPVEITVFRNPDDFTLLGDLKRRDFTINALAFSPETGVIDPAGGMNDLNEKLIRAVENPKLRITEDPLRLLRALRLASVLGFEIEEKTDIAIHEMKSLVNSVAAERISDELAKMICGKNLQKVLSSHGDIIHVIIPEISDDELYIKALEVIGHVKPILVLRLTALFSSFDEKGADLGKILFRLRFPNEIIENVKAIHRNLLIPSDIKRAELMKLINELGFDLTFALFSLEKAIAMVWEPDNTGYIEQIDELTSEVEKIKGQNTMVNLKSLQVNGNDLISMGMKQGKAIKEILNYLLEGVYEGRFNNSHDELIERVKWYGRELGASAIDLIGECNIEK